MSAQVRRPLVVQLDSGMVITRPLIGIDTAAFTSMRLSQALDKASLALRARRILVLKATIANDSTDKKKLGRELTATRHDVATLRLDVAEEQKRTQKALALPVQKPFFLDPNTYKGGALVVVGGALFKIFILPKLSKL